MKKQFITLLLSLSVSLSAWAETYKVNFQGVEIGEFIGAVSKNLNKTFIIDRNVGGTIDVRSYEPLGEEEYFAFFEYVLTTYGYSLVMLNENIYKVVPSQATKGEPMPVVTGSLRGRGDGVVTKIIKADNVAVSALTPILRQLINEAGSGNISHHDASNTIMLTDRASVIRRLETLIEQIDAAGSNAIATISLQNAKASEVVKLIDATYTNKDAREQGGKIKPTLVADDRTNTILIVASGMARTRLERLIHKLDRKVKTQGDTRVFYLQYAKAEEIAKVLQGVSTSMKADAGNPPAALPQQTVVTADPSSNSVVVITSPARMQAMEQVINQLDVRRAQVLIEAMIVEVTENDNAQYGVQWSNNRSAMVQFSGSGASISSALLAKNRAKNNDYAGMQKIAGGIKGLMAGVAFSDWNMLVSALAGSTQSNILAAPSLMVLDNEEASFVVGEEVPVKTGEQINGDFKNVFATIERKDVGIKLTIRPQINQGRMVQMKLQQEISNVIGANGTVDVRFGKRQLKTSVMAADQQMIVLSGLIDQRNGQTVAKIPVLGDIPLIGSAFKETIKSNEKRHLMLFIKPTIIRSDELATEASRRKYAHIRGKQGAVAEDDSAIEQIPPYSEPFNYPPEVQVMQRQLGDF